MKSIREINTEIKEGQCLIAALAMLSCQPGFSDKEPDTILALVSSRARAVYADEYGGEVDGNHNHQGG